MAIRDFLWCMDKTNRKETHFQVGLNWKFFFGSDFLKNASSLSIILQISNMKEPGGF
jgi:hypothetical protein